MGKDKNMRVLDGLIKAFEHIITALRASRSRGGSSILIWTGVYKIPLALDALRLTAMYIFSRTLLYFFSSRLP